MNQAVVKALNCQDEEQIVRICAIPAYWVYDGFTKDLPSALIYERILDCQHPLQMRTDALTFLRSCLVSNHHQQDGKPFIPQDMYQRMPPQEAREWAVRKFNLICPPLPPPPGGAPPPPPGAGVGAGTGQGAQGAAVVAVAAAATAGAATGVTLDANTVTLLLNIVGAKGAVAGEEKKDDDVSSPKIGEVEKKNMRRMCGLSQDASFEAFLQWFQKMFDKHLTTQRKKLSCQTLWKNILSLTKLKSLFILLS